ncbi:sulfurtransferase TusA family protein [Jonesia quinghaiensis]|uniref:sulfurtransferase TusA family protein n=1 Tax=Jonesia quinghaiensis TaxID=262806 RepID=UPI000424506B|nr:sulfurtransferase TusA family protein [Jonesia quinghaiensis]
MIAPAPDVFDTTGAKCVTMLLKIRARLAELPVGGQLVVVSDDPTSVYDLPAWCHMTHHTYVGVEHDGEVLRHTLEVTDKSVRSTAGRAWASPTP